MTPLLICTDLDGTLLPNGRAIESPMARCYFQHLIQASNAQLAYVSGRSLSLVEAAIQDYALPKPHYIIADVGASLYGAHQHTWQPCMQWQQHIMQTWSEHYVTQIKQLLQGFPDLNLQATAQQTTCKISYFAKRSVPPNVLLENLQRLFTQQHLTVNVIYSVDEITNIGLVDILPPRASKYHAIDFLRKQQHILLKNTIFAGDSGNDLSVLVSDIPCILVKNADTQLKQQVLQLSHAIKQTDTLYIAQGHCLGLNGHYAAGIVEGILHYHPELQKLL